jgi:hypothetical protein
MKSKSEKIGLVLMTTVIVAISSFAVITIPVSAQPVEVWNVTWGGTGDDYGFATATGDSVYLAGYTDSFGAGNADAFLNKYDNDGNLLWNVTWGGTGDDYGFATATGDSVYLAGTTDSFGAGSGDAFLNKYDNDGNLLWNVTWGGTGWDDGYATATGDDSVYLAGYTDSFGAGGVDAFLNKYDNDGNLLWNVTWGGTEDDVGWATATGDSVYLAGYTDSFGAGARDAFLNKYDNDGNLLWNVTWGGTGKDYGWATATGDSVYLAGSTNSFGAGGVDAFLNKYDNDGNLLWNVTWGGTGWDYGFATATGDNSVYLAGETTSFGTGGLDAFLNKYDNNDGNLLWNVTWGGTGRDVGLATATGDDSVYLAGYTNSFGAGNNDAFLVKYSEPGPTPPPAKFDTGPGTYPSISGTHNGTIIPNQTITASKLYTYPCTGTGGHAEYARIWNSSLDTNATWNGYIGDWQNISFNKTFTLVANETYNYTIRTGSYPQIIHAKSKPVTGGTINCTKFVDANGRTYNDWIPAIRLEK